MSARGSIHAPQVADVMTRAPIVVAPDCSLTAAAEIMAERSIRHLPVIEDGLLAGLVSQRDLLAASDRDAVVRDVMSAPCAVVAQDAPAFEAARTLLALKIGCLPVVDGGALAGIVTETDFVRVAYAMLAATSASAARASRGSARKNASAKASAPAKASAKNSNGASRTKRAKTVSARSIGAKRARHAKNVSGRASH